MAICQAIQTEMQPLMTNDSQNNRNEEKLDHNLSVSSMVPFSSLTITKKKIFPNILWLYLHSSSCNIIMMCMAITLTFKYKEKKIEDKNGNIWDLLHTTKQKSSNLTFLLILCLLSGNWQISRANTISWTTQIHIYFVKLYDNRRYMQRIRVLNCRKFIFVCPKHVRRLLYTIARWYYLMWVVVVVVTVIEIIYDVKWIGDDGQLQQRF